MIPIPSPVPIWHVLVAVAAMGLLVLWAWLAEEPDDVERYRRERTRRDRRAAEEKASQ